MGAIGKNGMQIPPQPVPYVGTRLYQKAPMRGA